MVTANIIKSKPFEGYLHKSEIMKVQVLILAEHHMQAFGN